jgi:hypothetical protein
MRKRDGDHPLDRAGAGADGEMHGDSAMSEGAAQARLMPDSTLSGEANLLVFPNLDAANIALGVVKTMTEALHVGPILLGSCHARAHPVAVGDLARRGQHGHARRRRGILPGMTKIQRIAAPGCAMPVKVNNLGCDWSRRPPALGIKHC